jgi:hypothetical protein
MELGPPSTWMQARMRGTDSIWISYDVVWIWGAKKVKGSLRTKSGNHLAEGSKWLTNSWRLLPDA